VSKGQCVKVMCLFLPVYTSCIWIMVFPLDPLTALCFLWRNSVILKHAIALQDSIKHFYFFFPCCWVFFFQLAGFPFDTLVLLATHPSTFYMSLIDSNFCYSEFYFIQFVFLHIFQTLLFSQFSNKLLFSLYYFTCCNCFVIYKKKVGSV